MKTIKQIADELGISKQRVARYIKSNHLSVSRSGSMIQINETVESLIKKHFIENNHINEPIQNHFNDTVYDTLIKQLEEKDNQIKSLLEKLDQEQKLHLATIQDKQQLQIELKEIKEENKQVKLSFWDRILGKNNS